MRHYCHIRHRHASEIATASSFINSPFKMRYFSLAAVHIHTNMLSLAMQLSYSAGLFFSLSLSFIKPYFVIQIYA